jgi:hypothetical protein
MSIVFRTTTDASAVYRERTAVRIARSYSSSETGNLAAVTKNSTFICDDVIAPEQAPGGQVGVPLPPDAP